MQKQQKEVVKQKKYRLKAKKLDKKTKKPNMSFRIDLRKIKKKN